MCGYSDKTKALFGEMLSNLKDKLEKLRFYNFLENNKIIVFVIIEDERSNSSNQYVNYFYNQCNSIKSGKAKKKVKWRNQNEGEVSCIDIWDDVFLHTDKASSQNYGIFLMRVNNNQSSLSGTAEILKMLSFIPSTYVVELSEKSSEDQLFNCSLISGDSGSRKTYAEIINFLLSNQNLTNFTKNAREFMDCIKNINQKDETFKHLNIAYGVEPTIENEEVSFTLSNSTKTTQSAIEDQTLRNNKNNRQGDESEGSPIDPKKLKFSKDESDDADEDNDLKDGREECARAYQVAEQRKNLTKNQTITLVQDVKKLNIETKHLNTLDDVEQYLTALPYKTHDYGCIFRLPEDIFIKVFKFLNDDDKLNLIFTSEGFVNIFQVSRTILKKFNIKVNKHNIDKLLKHPPLHRIPIINLSIDLEGIDRIQKYSILLNLFKGSIEQLEIKSVDFKNYNEFYEFFINIPNLKTLNLQKCKIGFMGNDIFPQIPYLESIYFNKCHDNIFKALQNQASVRTITVRNDDWTWNGFPHNILNQMAINSKNLKKIVLIGAGTGSFFDSDDISFKIEKLDTTMITFHWYVGIKSGRVSFLKSQLGHLKELTIHKLPFDFDGGKVLKYIIEEMNLNKFYYGKIPLILNGMKQDVKEFEANEIQITSTYEMFRQFPSISSFRFILSATDIASDEIERVINPPTNLFENVKEFEVIDNSRYRGTLGVFLGLFKNMRNVRKLILKTQDRNINTLLGEFLRCMPNLIEIYLTSAAPRGTERLNIIKSFVPNIHKLSVAPQFIEDAKNIFGSDIKIHTVESEN